ncbi:hypothetical protein DKN91_17190 [Escherichia coli]|uniref:hypothetical protein n=1 Tax=Escherichia coli TaxID=562 RepID=UPI00099176D0|nr:hypothetical protein [Escherichia coli]EJH5272484.1 hypothetical protein [Escherichia coli O145:H28]EEU9835026.1 hypothetical protein [Escherichia coli]EEV0892700.1 hypothetical protein [Escherichia coli]EFC7346570.1 hypothetical protein [Escherichia coli]EFO1731078.1 hypothetical protein [Escherichia coli]
MKVCIFILLIFAGVLVFPDACFYTFVKRFIPISGDGEYGMNNFEMTVLLVKTLACALGAGAVITLFRTR